MTESAQQRVGVYDGPDAEMLDPDDLEEIDEELPTQRIPPPPEPETDWGPEPESIQISITDSAEIAPEPLVEAAMGSRQRWRAETSSLAAVPVAKRGMGPLVIGGAIGVVLLILGLVALLIGSSDEDEGPPVAAGVQSPEAEAAPLEAEPVAEPPEAEKADEPGDSVPIVVPSSSPLTIMPRRDDQMRVTHLTVGKIRGKGCAKGPATFSARKDKKIAACVQFTHSRKRTAKLVWRKEGKTVRRKVKKAPASARYSMAAPLVLGKQSVGKWQVQVLVDDTEVATYDFVVEP